VLLFVPLAFGEPPRGFGGVWKFQPQSSKTAGSAPQSLLMSIDYEGSRLRQKLVGVDRGGREQRMEFVFDLGGVETANDLHGVAVRSRTRWDGDVLVIESSFRVSQPPTEMEMEERLYLSPDEHVLSLDRVMRRKSGSGQSDEMREALRFE